MNAGREAPPLHYYPAYALPGMVLAAMGITFYVYLPKHYADAAGVNLTLLGAITLGARMWDAVIDPLIGSLSDRTRSRWGRRRPWYAAGTVPLVAAFYLLLNPPAGMPEWGAAAWLAVVTFAFFLFWTAVTVPYEALGAEITFNYDARTRIIGAREAAILVGTLLASILPLAVDWMWPPGASPEGVRTRFAVLAAAYGLMLPLCVAWCALAIPERRLTKSQEPAGAVLGGLRDMLKNRPFAILISSYTIGAFGSNLPALLIFFYVQYVLESSKGPLFLALYLGVGVLFTPAWFLISNRIDKKPAWLLAMALNTGAFCGVFFLGAGDETAYGILVAVSALGLGGTLAVPASMQADVIDHDEWKNGKRREGRFVGVWALARKLAAALGAGAAFPVLDAAGYVPNADQPESAVFALRVLYAGVPCLCNILAFAVAWYYPITRESHARIRAEIEGRAAAGNEGGAKPASNL